MAMAGESFDSDEPFFRKHGFRRDVGTMTVSDLLSWEVLADARVLAGERWLDHHPVEWVSVIEVPVEDFIRRHEFVLTTGVGCGTDLHLFAGFVDEVAAAGAAGLAVAVGRHVMAVPDEIVDLAEQRHLPLVEIPWEVRFADIIRRAYAELAVETSGDYEAGFLRQLLFRIVRRESLDTVIELVSQMWHASCVFFDARTGRWRGAQHGVQWCQDHRHQLEAGMRPPEFRLEDKPQSRVVDGIHVEYVSLQSPIRWYGTLVVRPESDSVTHGLYRDHIEAAAAIVALAVLLDDVDHRDELRQREDFAWMLAKGEFKTWDDVLDKAGVIRCDVSQYYVCVVGCLHNWDEIYQNSQTVFERKSRETWQLEMIRTIQGALIAGAKAANYEALTTYQRDLWVSYLVSVTPPLEARLHEILDAVEAAVAFQANHAVMSWGVASGVPRVEGFHEAFQNAQKALETGIRRHGAGVRMFYDRVQQDQVLSQFLQSSAVQELVQTTMGGLIEYDRRHGTDLVRTLASYLFNRSNVSLTARTLHLHRQSLLYRLNKIQTLTGRTLEKPDDLFVLELCLRMLDAMGPDRQEP